MKTVYELWRKTDGAMSYTRSGSQHPDIDTAMATAGYPTPADWRWANSDQINMVPTDAATTRSGDRSKWVLIPKKVAENDADRVELAVGLALNYGQTDGEHHKTWVIDQIVRTLTGDRYAEVIAEYRDGEDGPDTYSWEEGIAP